MGYTSIIGIALGAFFVVYSILIAGNLSDFYNFPSIVIVLGGTFASMLVNFPISEFKRAWEAIRKVAKYRKTDLKEIEKQIIDLSFLSKRGRSSCA